jgi:hypothetical protein
MKPCVSNLSHRVPPVGPPRATSPLPVVLEVVGYAGRLEKIHNRLICLDVCTMYVIVNW